MAYFHCLIGGGSSGGGYELTVTCDADFAGTTITATDGVTTLTQTCPSASPYEVVFAIPNGGTWTVSGIISGSTFTESIDIPDSLELHSVPEGSTVLPTDDIQTWLACAGIRDKSYTTLNEVLADSTTLLALISDNNASDYLVRSTTWASGITADSTAMTDIGANNYCANTLLSDSTWAEAICDSTYFESVLNVKVPVMTGYTTPEGQVITSSENGGDSISWKAFDNNTNTAWESQQGVTQAYCGYIFTSPVAIKKVAILGNDPSQYYTFSPKDFNIEWSDDESTWTTDSTNFTYTVNQGSSALHNFFSPTLSGSHKGWRINVHNTCGANYITVRTLQFYGRADV